VIVTRATKKNQIKMAYKVRRADISFSREEFFEETTLQKCFVGFSTESL
jgi:hypothetical protein